jgi:hypothetical protein
MERGGADLDRKQFSGEEEFTAECAENGERKTAEARP